MKNAPVLVCLALSISILAGCQIENGQKPLPDANQRVETKWEEIRAGLSQADIFIVTEKEEYKNLLLVKIDPRRYEFSIYENKKSDKNKKTIEEIHTSEDSLLTFNGQFFTEDFRPTGLLITEGKKLRSHSSADLMNGILAIDTGRNVHFFEGGRDLNEKQYHFAIQNGPVLIDEEGAIKIPEDSGQTASRTAIGKDREGNIVLIVLKQSLLNFENRVSLYEFAHILKEAPELQQLELHSVVNLDGGTSTGLMIGDRYFPEMEKVQNVILVKER